MLQKIKKNIIPEKLAVFFLLCTAVFLSTYRVGEILAFHYDQGRDALVIWDLVREPYKFFLIGPTTGLAGVFRGPFYYYLIAPFYWLGQGNPIVPAVFLALLSGGALYLVYVLGKELGGVKTGFLALILSAFSFEIVYASRWLSNPTPMLILSMLMLLSLFRIYDGKKYYWILLSLVLGLSFFNFGSSGELFYFPVAGVFLLWSLVKQGFGKTKSTLNWKILFASAAVFLITFAPLLIFNIRHGGLLGSNLNSLVGSEKSFAVPSWRFVQDRSNLIFDYFGALIFHSPFEKESIYFVVLFLAGVYYLSTLLKNPKVKILMGFLGSVFVGLLFYHGNYGNLYAYYLTGYYLFFLLAVALVLGKIAENSLPAKLLLAYFLVFFLTQNLSWIKPYLTDNGQNPDSILFINQKKAIDWVYNDSQNRDFNVDVYVPPVIPHSYDYLFKWLGTEKYGKLPSDSQVALLYTIYEADPDHKDRLKAWLDRQKGIGTLVKSETFGGITVEQRNRIKNE